MQNGAKRKMIVDGLSSHFAVAVSGEFAGGQRSLNTPDGASPFTASRHGRLPVLVCWTRSNQTGYLVTKSISTDGRGDSDTDYRGWRPATQPAQPSDGLEFRRSTAIIDSADAIAVLPQPAGDPANQCAVPGLGLVACAAKLAPIVNKRNKKPFDAAFRFQSQSDRAVPESPESIGPIGRPSGPAVLVASVRRRDHWLGIAVAWRRWLPVANGLSRLAPRCPHCCSVDGVDAGRESITFSDRPD